MGVNVKSLSETFDIEIFARTHVVPVIMKRSYKKGGRAMGLYNAKV